MKAHDLSGLELLAAVAIAFGVAALMLYIWHDIEKITKPLRKREDDDG